MRLDFNILWVEDQSNNVLSQRDAIDRKIRNEGFRLQTKFATSVDEAKQNLSEDIYGDHIDLVLMDYDLGAGSKGDQGLEEVRTVFQFKEIVFYSAGAADLAKLVAEKGIQGVFCSTRNELPTEVFGVFETLVKKVLDIDHARGIVMGSSSDIDGLIFDCLAAHFSKSEDGLSPEAIQIISSRLEEICERFQKTVAAISAATKVTELREHYSVYTSIDRLNLLRKLLKPISAHATACEVMRTYASETVAKRNDLAHVRVKRDGFSRKLFDRRNNEISREDVRALRLELLRHQEALENLLEELRKP